LRVRFPDSEIRGSEGARPYSRLIAACYVLHRLCAPRHPPDALALTLDRSAFVPCPERRPVLRGANKFAHLRMTLSPENGYLRSVLVSYGSTGRANRLTPPSQCQRSEYGTQGPERSRFRISCPISVDDAGLLRRSSRLQPAFALRATARSPSSLPRAKASGADRDRTDDLKLAKLALSQLSYGPLVR
jgi:hypothetical protein